MDLLHYTNNANLVPCSCDQLRDTDDKPSGLWVSIGEAWKKFCIDAQFRRHALDYVYQVHLSDTANILTLDNPAKVEAFEAAFKEVGDKDYMGIYYPSIHWRDVAECYQGIIIPTHRLHGSKWHRTWDIPSGCIWDASAIASVELVSAPELADV